MTGPATPPSRQSANRSVLGVFPEKCPECGHPVEVDRRRKRFVVVPSAMGLWPHVPARDVRDGTCPNCGEGFDLIVGNSAAEAYARRFGRGLSGGSLTGGSTPEPDSAPATNAQPGEYFSDGLNGGAE